MARIFIDGFEAGDLKLWDTVGNDAAIAAGGMDGSYCLNLNTISISYLAYVEKIVPSAAEYYVAFTHKGGTAYPDYIRAILSFYNGTTLLGRITRNITSGFLEVRRGDTVIATGGVYVSKTATTLIEVRYKPHSDGVFQVRVNGVLDITFSGNTTSGFVTIDRIRFGSISSDGWPNCWIDNVVIDNAAWPGNTKIQGLVVNGAGAANEWAPSGDLNYQCVDEKPVSFDDFVSTNTIGHKDTYGIGALTGSIESIKAVQVQATAVKEGNPTPANLQLATRVGGADYFGGDNAIPTAAKAVSKLWELNPALIATAWDEDAVNAIEIGMKAVA